VRFFVIGKFSSVVVPDWTQMAAPEERFRR